MSCLSSQPQCVIALWNTSCLFLLNLTYVDVSHYLTNKIHQSCKKYERKNETKKKGIKRLILYLTISTQNKIKYGINLFYNFSDSVYKIKTYEHAKIYGKRKKYKNNKMNFIKSV